MYIYLIVFIGLFRKFKKNKHDKIITKLYKIGFKNKKNCLTENEQTEKILEKKSIIYVKNIKSKDGIKFKAIRNNILN